MGAIVVHGCAPTDADAPWVVGVADGRVETDVAMGVGRRDGARDSVRSALAALAPPRPDDVEIEGDRAALERFLAVGRSDVATLV